LLHIVCKKYSSAPTKEHFMWVQAGEDQAGTRAGGCNRSITSIQ